MKLWNKIENLNTVERKTILYKILISILFGLAGFFLNFQTIIFPFGQYKVAILFGLLFPLIIALAWGPRYGFLSAITGGSQSMWWIWGPSSGYAIFSVVPPFTLWLVWHGFFAELRRKNNSYKWWLSPYVVEIPFRLLNSLNLLFLTKWAKSMNPPPWKWAANASATYEFNISLFAVFKQASVAFMLLLMVDVLLNLGHVRTFFKLSRTHNNQNTGYILSVSLLFGCLYWILDSIFYVFVFHKDSLIIDLLVLNIPAPILFTRIVIFILCLIFGLFTAKILRKQKESEVKYKTLIKSTPLPLCLVDGDGNIAYINDRFVKIFGYTIQDIPTIDNWWIKAYPDPHYRSWALNTWNIAVEKAGIENTDIESAEYNVTCKTGDTRIITISGIILNEGLLVTFIDVTDPKKAEEEILINQKRYKKAESIGHVGNWEYDFLTTNFWASEEVKIIFGFDFKSTEFDTERVEKCIPERVRVHQALIDLIEHNKKYDLIYDILTEDKGIRKSIHSIAVIERDALGDPIRISGVVSDITERKQAEAELIEAKKNAQKSENYLNKIINNIGDPVFVKDNQSRIILCNDAFCSLMELPRNQMIGKTLDKYVRAEERESFLMIDKQVLADGKENINEESITVRGSQTRIISTKKTRFIGENGKYFLVGVLRDITESKIAEEALKKSEEQLHQSQKMDAVGQLAGGIAHDFNNSLAGIIGATEMLLSGHCDSKKQKKYLDIILTSAERTGELTKKLLFFSRKGNSLITNVDMIEIINETVDLLEHTIDKNITISIVNNSTNTIILGDDSMLQNAMINLAINSSHAMLEGGKIVFTLENIILDSVYCKASPFEIDPGQYLRIDIRDSGTGMSPDIQSHIFEPFFTTKEQGKGTGIGLATVYGAIKDHNGAINVYSEEGSGTVFHLFFPITHTRMEHPVPNDIVTGSGTILVIDDEELIRITSKAMLVSLGYKVLCAENGKIGVQMFSENSKDIDLVILDMIMPVMNGREAFGKIREINNNIPVIISSGFAKDSDLLVLKKQGVSGFLHKPFRRVELAEVVAGILVPTNHE